MHRTTTRIRHAALALAAAALLPLSLAACSSGGEERAEETASEPETAAGDEAAGGRAAGAAAAPFGPACSAVPEDGAGSFDGMAQDPVATAASHNPVLSTLVTAVTEAGLADTLNAAEGLTVFAPVDEAFAAVPEEDLNAVLADRELLTGVLTYHVVGERLGPEELAEGSGTLETLQGGTLTVSGSGEDLTVNEEAAVVCGNVQTANATVYLIDTVLMPAA
ncbi:fasciclin domain-containing protein [Streptomyces aidingensis]|uniref:Uncaracterized surface protein containing fasciclin (FAS1) repeats n=1 Tax=Streptomyces aidingensis TaxID=910347 RepID=A0A1I1J2V4_9ACTN|nr:fasciclin domain-containing protein [Streptomyces aidingensis]SFC42441.1 Uncaracterized surface protein containing fasciclin (FAS1) repeats [Streptomyces aidingensis]